LVLHIGDVNRGGRVWERSVDSVGLRSGRRARDIPGAHP